MVLTASGTPAIVIQLIPLLLAGLYFFMLHRKAIPLFWEEAIYIVAVIVPVLHVTLLFAGIIPANRNLFYLLFTITFSASVIATATSAYYFTKRSILFLPLIIIYGFISSLSIFLLANPDYDGW